MIHVRVEGAGPCWLFAVATLPRPRARGRSQPKCRAAAVHEAELKYRKELNCRSPIEPSGNAAIPTSGPPSWSSSPGEARMGGATPGGQRAEGQIRGQDWRLGRDGTRASCGPGRR
jgi:hypothetical protein